MSTHHAIGTLEQDGEPLAVISAGERLYPLAAAAETIFGPSRMAELEPAGAITVLGVLDAWDRWSGALGELADALVSGESGGVQPVERPASWLAPILHPRKVIGIGANYKDHLDFAGIPYPETPYLFLKPASTTLLGSGREMVIPHQVQYADWEGELAVIIGRRARQVSEAEALEFVAGYTPANDFSARDWLANAIPPLGSDWLLHKGWDGFTPIGPLITPAEFVPDPQRLGIRLSVDGVTKQDGNTSKMVFPVAKLIAHASTVMTLEPGDVLLTGTPMGSGFAVQPQERLTPGQTMVVEVDGLGTLTTPTVRRSA
jgi:2-keto-4-pentenoate hydratase/2-oxohepta-3-ene-1,7-dioic acid hydratase in catechol pathway